MNILLTGASGFIGQAINLKLNDHFVRITSRKMINDPSSNKYKKDMSSDEDFSDCLDGIDVVIQTAARVHKMRDKSLNPLKEYMEINCNGTLNLAKQAVKAGVKRFIFISTIKVSGEKSEHDEPFSYDSEVNTSDPYAISKAKAEEGLLEISNNEKLEIVIIRPPLVYGPGVKANFLSLINIVNMSLPLPFKSIKNKRSFVALDNLVDLIITCIDHPNASRNVFLVSDDRSLSTPELIEVIAKSLNKKPILYSIKIDWLLFMAMIFKKKDLLNRLMHNLEIDMDHTKKTLNWSPPITTEDGIKRCIPIVTK